jgi:hypothetical protein
MDASQGRIIRLPELDQGVSGLRLKTTKVNFHPYFERKIFQVFQSWKTTL